MTNLPATQKSVRETLISLTSNGSLSSTLSELLGDKKPQFLSTLVSIINSDPKLIQVFYENPLSILNIAIQIVNLDLPLGNQFGFAYIVSRYNKRQGKNEAQLMLGYKGLLQMAIRSGKYKTIKVIAIHEGEISEIDHLSGEIKFKWNQDIRKRNSTPVIGYVGILKFLNGFTHQIFVTREEIEEREKKFRQGQNQSAAWESNFDSMAEKTVIKMMLSRYGYVGFGTSSVEQNSPDYDNISSEIECVEDINEETGEIIN